jgi:hypothetical protein
MVGAIIPVLPFLFLDGTNAVAASAAVTYGGGHLFGVAVVGWPPPPGLTPPAHHKDSKNTKGHEERQRQGRIRVADTLPTMPTSAKDWQFDR